MTRIPRNNWSLLYVLFFSLLAMPVLAGPKGSLEPNELEWVKNTFKPILIKGNICGRADADCNHNFLICMSSDTLSCDVYGITDEIIIKEILLAALNSGMNVSSWSFWKSKYHEVRLFEKPLLEYRDRTEGKISGAK